MLPKFHLEMKDDILKQCTWVNVTYEYQKLLRYATIALDYEKLYDDKDGSFLAEKTAEVITMAHKDYNQLKAVDDFEAKLHRELECFTLASFNSPKYLYLGQDEYYNLKKILDRTGCDFEVQFPHEDKTIICFLGMTVIPVKLKTHFRMVGREVR